MQATFHLHTSELNDDFFASLKTFTQNRSLRIILEITGNDKGNEPWDDSWEDTDGLDETERIRRNPALHADIMRSLAQADAGNLIEVDMDKILAGVPPHEAIINRPMEMAA
ncbi:MAG: hypothetical protein EAZ92_12530 [Candidatus Kapaibacterium sp.]|nr:MAG: hypothetical protein EAZ92_12530 [Candidatus Kapabacteria bacterium]